MQPLLVRLGLNAKDFNAGFLEARKNLEQVRKNTDELSKSMQNMNKVAKLAFSAWGIYNVREALQSLVRYVGEVSIELDRMKRSMNAATGSISLGAHAIQFLQQESQRLGLQFRDQIQGFQQLTAAAKGTSLTYKDVREVWLGISEASTVMQLSSEQNKYALYALQQMISKGVVTMEELRRQLGDQIPGAFQIAARAMGVTTQELIKMVSTGNLISEEFVPKFAKQLRKEMAGSVEDASKSIYSNINRIKNDFYSLADDIAHSSGGIDAFNQSLKDFVEFIKDPDTKQTIEDMAKLFVGIAQGIEYIGKVSTKVMKSTGLGDLFHTFANLKENIKLGEISNITKDIEKYTNQIERSREKIKQWTEAINSGQSGSWLGKNFYMEQRLIKEEQENIDTLIRKLNELKNKRKELADQPDQILTGRQVPDDIYGDTTEWDLRVARRQEIIQNFIDSTLSSEAKAIAELNKSFKIVNAQIANLGVTTEELVKLQDAYANKLNEFAEKRRRIIEKWEATASENEVDKALLQKKREYEQNKKQLHDLVGTAEEYHKLEVAYNQTLQNIVNESKKKREGILSKWESKTSMLKEDSELKKLEAQYEDFKKGLDKLKGTSEEFARLEQAYNKKITDILNDNTRSRQEIIASWEELSAGLSEEEKRLLELENKYVESRNKLIDLSGGGAASDIEKLKKAFASARITASDYFQTYKSFIGDIKNITQDTFADMFKGNIDGWQDMINRMRDAYLDMISELVTHELFKNIKVGKFAQGGQTINGAAPGTLTNLFGKQSYNVGGSAIGGAFMGASSSNDQSYLSTVAMGAAQGYAIGGPWGALGGAAGSLLGKWLWGDKKKNFSTPKPSMPETFEFVRGWDSPQKKIGQLFSPGYTFTGGMGSYAKQFGSGYPTELAFKGPQWDFINKQIETDYLEFVNQFQEVKNKISENIQQIVLKVPQDLSQTIISKLEGLTISEISGKFTYDFSNIAEIFTKHLNQSITKEIGLDIEKYIETQESYKILSGYTQEKLRSPFYTYENGKQAYNSFANVEDIVNTLNYLQQVKDAWNNITLTAKEFTGKATTYERGIDNINKQFDDMRETLISLGVAVERINEIESQRMEAIYYFNRQISLQREDILDQWYVLAGVYTEERAALIDLKKQYNAAVEALGGLNTDETDYAIMERLYGRAVQKIKDSFVQSGDEISDVAERQADKISEMLNQWRISSGALSGEQADLLNLKMSFDNAVASLNEFQATSAEIAELTNFYNMSIQNIHDQYAELLADQQNQIVDMIDQWKVSSGFFNEQETMFFQLKKQYDEAKKSLEQLGASSDQFAELQSLYEKSLGNIVDSFTTNITDSFSDIQNAWSSFFDTVMNDLSPVQSSAYFGQKLSTLYSQSNTEEGISNLLNFVQSEYLPFMKAYGESDYNKVWENIRDLTGNIMYNGQAIGGIDYNQMGSTIGQYVSAAMANDNSKIIIQIGDRTYTEIMLSALRNNDPELVNEIRRVING